jgi:nitrogen-specific signal transduction histidine kinase
MKTKDFQILTFPNVKKSTKKKNESEHVKYLKQLKIIAHDLNNILTNISSGVQLAKNNIDDKLQVSNLLEHIENNTEKASEIVNEILTKNDTTIVKKNKLSLENIIDETIISIKDSLSEKTKIEFNPIAVNDNIFANHTDIYRVILNLIINANDAIATGKGKISIELSNWRDSLKNPIDRRYIEYAVITVKDNGKGIAKENLSKIFTEGFSTKQNKTKESGFGLSIIKRIIESNDGFIKVESKRNKGTTFKIFIPTLTKENEKLSFHKQTVIIAEDDSFQREVLKDLISSMNLKVLSAVNGIDVLNYYNREKIDLIIVDKNMPEMDGIECIKEIRRTDLSIPIILSTGNSYEELKEEISKNKISRILKKPYSFESIQNLLLELLV